MAHFNQAYIDFFTELEKNNSKEWFDDHRKTYEKEVKKPFAAFVDLMIERIQEYEPEVEISSKDAVFRINNDVRFAKNKPLYKTQMGANISRYGRKNKAYPGFYFEIAPQHISIFGGAYMVESPVLQSLRELIQSDTNSFQSAIGNAAFKKQYGSIQGEQHKRLPKEFVATAEKEPLIANKQFYYTTKLDGHLILKDDLDDQLMAYYQAAKPVNDFLKRAF